MPGKYETKPNANATAGAAFGKNWAIGYPTRRRYRRKGVK